MSHSDSTPEERYAIIVAALTKNAAVTLGSEGKKGFGSSALRINNKIFAMFSGGTLVVKLPRQRVDALIAAGLGERFDPGHGRLMKEWLALVSAAEAQWLALAQEAMEFVASKS